MHAVEPFSSFPTESEGHLSQDSSPDAPTLIEKLPLLHLVQFDSAEAPLSIKPYVPGMQLMQTDSLVAPITELHFPSGHPLQAVVAPSNSENLPLVQFLHPSNKFFACSVLPRNPRGQDKHTS